MPTEDQSTVGKQRRRNSGAALVHRTDFALALIVLAACAALYYVTTTFEEVPSLLAQNIQPEFFPQLLLWLIVLLTLVLPVEHRFLEKGSEGLDKGRRHRIKGKTVATAGLLAGLVAAMPWVGTYLSMLFVCLLMPLLWGERRLWVLLPFAFLFPTAVTLLFTQALKVYFEPGLLGPVLH